MQIVKTKLELREARARLEGRVGFAPTMGYLHDGHMALMHASRAENDHTIASVFVNPTQFGKGEDLETYPRALDRDAHMLEAAGVDVLFVPITSEMYGEEARTFVEVGGISDELIGALRPGHFRGVATVVTKLLNLATPDNAYFGEKDYQQLAILRAMTRDLDSPVNICGVPIVREADGLAMSSRNVRLSPEDRLVAPILHQALQASRQELSHNTMTAKEVESFVRLALAKEPRADVRAVDVRDASDLSEIDGAIECKIVVLLSIKFGDVFLIDNMVLAPASLSS